MYVNKYEAPNRTWDKRPTQIVFVDATGLEGEVLIGSERYRKLVQSEIGPIERTQVHYALLDGLIYRVTVGKDEHIGIPVRIGNDKTPRITPKVFGSLFPQEPELTESKVNRSIRKSLRTLIEQELLAA
ncbi:MAG TPA: hypothetical protein VJI97_00090 [Candidatus Nanoarchaeia archaeon]|nr:hypothetical protein [Candidatus Nanoarchaeia archaeon]